MRFVAYNGTEGAECLVQEPPQTTKKYNHLLGVVHPNVFEKLDFEIAMRSSGEPSELTFL